jgi:MYXO-CTERM domain-containing protein
MPGGTEQHAPSGGGTSPRTLVLPLLALAIVLILLRRAR